MNNPKLTQFFQWISIINTLITFTLNLIVFTDKVLEKHNIVAKKKRKTGFH